MKDFVKRRIRDAGYRVSRLRPENRFDAMEGTLQSLRRMAYQPRIIIDAGANQGNWTRMAMRLFPEARIHLIEPQPACHEVLRSLVEGHAKLTLHECALTRPGISSVRMTGLGGDGSGAWVLAEGESAAETIECPASTLDELFAGKFSSEHRCLLKLDMERHEWTALQGAERLLESVEVIITEVQFFGLNSFPVFADILDRVRESDFDLFDIAALAPRLRDGRLRSGDVVFVRRGSPLTLDVIWS